MENLQELLADNLNSVYLKTIDRILCNKIFERRMGL